MITVAEAKKIIRENVRPLKPLPLPLAQSARKVLAADVYASVDIPAFDQSSMDGYAFLFAGWQAYPTLQIVGEVPAGSPGDNFCEPNQAVRIFTGAAIPPGADTVVMQEKVTTSGAMLTINDGHFYAGMNVRPTGAEIKAGTLALAAGNILSPAAIGFLAGIGVTTVDAYPTPVVSIIVTGKELQQPGNLLQRGQVYESNSAALSAALQQLNILNCKISSADDELDVLTHILQSAIEESDVVLLTGGISVGDYDFVLEAASKCGVEKLFHRIKQRPGKPLYFGKTDSCLVFGLPGNPSSVLTCFYEYVIPALLKLGNYKDAGLKILQVPLLKAFEKTAGLTQFLKGYYDGEKVMILDAQESFRLSSFAKANCLVKIAEDTTNCPEGEKVEIHLLPDN